MGCFFSMFTLPFQALGLFFKAIYWAFKILWEIIELFTHHSRRKGKRRRRAHTPRMKSTSAPSKTTPQGTNIPDELAASIEHSVKIARNKRRKTDTRLDSYRNAFRHLDQIKAMVTEKERAAVSILEEGLLTEYRSLLDRDTKTTGNVSIGPSLDLRTSHDARRHGIQGAQWVASDDSCPLCKSLDNMVISVNHPDYDLFVPPLHDGCRCIRVYIGADETNVEFNWVSPDKDLMSAHMN